MLDIPPGNFSVWNISLLDYLPDGHQVPPLVEMHIGQSRLLVLCAVVSVGMPGMLGMPGTKLGMLVAAGFSIFGGGSLRNVPTVSRQTSSGASAAGGCSAAPSVLSVVRVPSAQARASLC